MNIENEKIISNKHKILFGVGIILISLVIVGGTFAFLIFDVDIFNKNIASSTACFDIIYDAHNDTSPITGTLIPSSGPAGGLSGKVSIGMDANCNISGYGYFYLNITTGSDILFQNVVPHCEDSRTLKTLVDYTDQTSCEEDSNNKWVTDGTALKYVVYDTETVTSTSSPLSSGYINSLGKLELYTDFSISHELVDYYVYVWLDGNLSDNSYANQLINGEVSATVSQKPNMQSGTYAISFDMNGGINESTSEAASVLFTTVGKNEYIVPSDGSYKIEVWGAQGGGNGGYGGYSTGTLNLNSGDTLYVNVGGQGKLNAGGSNGGGAGQVVAGTVSPAGYGGGGATHIASSSGMLKNVNSSNIYIVAGGGGGGSEAAVQGGHAGGFKGNDSPSGCFVATGGTQTAGGTAGDTDATDGGYGYGGSAAYGDESNNYGAGGGGGGYYGGGGNSYYYDNPDCSSSGAGGSGYIGNGLLTDKMMYCYNCETSSSADTLTYSTTDVSETPTANYAKIGDGAARITKQGTSDKTVTNGSTYGELPTPSREGYVFVGWNTETDGTGEIITSDSIVNLSGDTTLYAIWGTTSTNSGNVQYQLVNDYGNNTGTVTVYYNTSYNSVTNQTTVTFTQNSVHRLGASENISFNCTTSITVEATDSGETASSSIYLSGNKASGFSYYYNIPSPSSIVVQHSNTTGSKSVIISSSTDYNPSDWGVPVCSNSETVTVGTYAG